MRASRRIAYLVSQYPAINHAYILREIRELRKLGWEANVVSISPDTRRVENLTGEEREELSQTYYVKSQGIGGALRAHLECLILSTSSYFRGVMFSLQLGGKSVRAGLRYMLYFTEALIVGRWMQQHSLNHAHIHFSSTVGLLLAKTFPVTISITIHGPAEFQDPQNFHLKEKVEASSFVCAISEYGRKQLMKACNPVQWEKLKTIPLGIDPDVFKPGPPRSSEGAMFTVISVGRLSPEKAQHILIDAVAALLQQGRNLRLRLAGEGRERPALEKHILTRKLSDYVRLEGALNQEQLTALYWESDAFALPSLAEGVPVVLMEAMAMEIPCVATRITGIPELIQDGANGLLVDPGNCEQLTNALARLIDDPSLRSQLGKAARDKVMEDYNLSKNTAALAEVLEEITDSSSISQAGSE